MAIILQYPMLADYIVGIGETLRNYWGDDQYLDCMEAKNKHLEMIQGVVSRMGQTSFLLKGWSVLLISALFALAAKEAKIYFVCLAYFPLLAFWGLDAYYLRQERLFRKLYDRVRLMEDSAVDFSMDTSLVSKEVDCWFCVVLSKTLLAFHGTVFFTILVIMIILMVIN